MIRLARFSRKLRKSRDGAVAVEFGLLATIMITMLLGVFQVGIGMQNYNAVRNVSAEVARYAMVQYETGNKLSNSQIRTFALSTARSAPYLLDHTRVEATVLDASPQRVAGAKELNLQIRYQVPIIIGFLGIPDPQIAYNRPIFLLED
ncbi:TadE/TadG family type IV pilus assembly protein [Altererythrobacter litoralis]|uniref:TadE/TadG family type IV pilus assembly protein n=1 Tax=Altererythrobacter litoralis TaxID=3113904 RepID=A0ABU7GBM3_9SPHN|nr:TadE/TadG family type IV pilus assembly protein [Erythrobacteraceae bacterium 1XM1-14]